jgi:hypothetical protein
LIGKETGFGQRSTFYGEQDILAVAVGAQYQKDGSVQALPPGATDTPLRSEFKELNADVLAEFKLGGGSFATGEAAYYKYFGDYNRATDQFYVTLAYATPPIGVGQFQPMVRYQYATGDGNGSLQTLDAFLGYIMRQQRLRVLAGFQRTVIGDGDPETPDLTANQVQIAAQAMFY